MGKSKKNKSNKSKSVSVAPKPVAVEEEALEGNGGFELKSFKKKGKTVKFVMETPFDYDVEHSLIVSLSLIVKIKRIAKIAQKATSDQDQLDVGLETITIMVGEDNFDKLLESAAQLSTIEEEGKMLGYLSRFIFDELLPKVQGLETE